MASSIFGNQNLGMINTGMGQRPTMLNTTTIPPYQTQNVQTPMDNMLSEISDAIKRNDNDIQKAFYDLAKKKNIDPSPIVNEINNMKDPNAFAMDLINNNPQLSQLMTLLGALK